MRMRAIAILTGLIFLISMAGLAMAQEAKTEAKPAAKMEVKHAYVGVKVCKMCHKKGGIAKDEIYESWEKTPHATVWDKLTDEQKKDEKFQKYYATGKLADGTLLSNVQCEACHGPGGDYKTMSIMKDKEKAIANGLVIPDANTCLKCHNADAPTEALKASAKDFDFAKMEAKGVHMIPKAEEKMEKK